MKKKKNRFRYLSVFITAVFYFSATGIHHTSAATIQDIKVRIEAQEFDFCERPVLEAFSSQDSCTVLGIEILGTDGAQAEGPGREAADAKRKSIAGNTADRKEEEIAGKTGYRKETEKINREQTDKKEKEYWYEITLAAETEEGFGVLSEDQIHLSGEKAVCRRAVRTDGGQTLRLEIELTEPGELIGEIPDVILTDGIARWEPAPGASAYYVSLYCDGKRLRDSHRTEGLCFDFSPLVQKAGNYFCRVYPLTGKGKKGKAAESSRMFVDVWKAEQIREKWDSTLSERFQQPLARGWIQTEQGWYYVNQDGTLPVNTCLTLEDIRYCFDADGRWEEEEGNGSAGS